MAWVVCLFEFMTESNNYGGMTQWPQNNKSGQCPVCGSAYQPGRCPTCDAKTLFGVDVQKNGNIKNMSREEIYQNGGTCPTCNAEYHPRKYKSGKVVYVVNQEPRHIDMIDEMAKYLSGRSLTEEENRRVIKKDEQIGDKSPDLVLKIYTDETIYPIKQAFEMIVSNDRSLHHKRKIYEKHDYVLICVRVWDYLGGIDIEQIRMREFRKSWNQ